jgi:hypothetical protein
MQTSFEYNGVLVKDVATELIDYTSVKESTGVDQIGVRGQCVFTGIIHAQTKTQGSTSIDHTGVRAANFRGDLDSLLKKLSKDRRRFTLKIGGTTIFSVAPGAAEPGVSPATLGQHLGEMDINNGPEVSVQVVKITAGVAAHIRFTVTFTVANCGNDKLGSGGLINFRFWVHEGIDCRTFLSNRTYMGRIRVAHKNISPHQLARIVTIPRLESGFKREVVQWDESSDGLTLDFTIRDQEKYAAAPWQTLLGKGAIDWQGSLTARTGNTFGFTGYYDFELELIGPKNVAKYDLINLGLVVAQEKCNFMEAVNAINAKGSKLFLDSLLVRESLHENRVNINCTIRYAGDSLIAGLLNLNQDVLIGKPLGDMGIGYSRDNHFTPKIPSVTAGKSALFLSLLQTPCKPATFPAPAITLQSSPGQTQNFQVTASQGDQASSPATVVTAGGSADNFDSMYFEYLIDSDIHINTGRLALANGAASSSTESPISIVNLHRPATVRCIRIDATRLNKSPQMPFPGKAFSDAVGIRHDPIGEPLISASAPQVSSDKRKLLFRVQMDLMYAMSRTPRQGESLPIGCVPYRASSFSDQSRVIPASAFVEPSLILR